MQPREPIVLADMMLRRASTRDFVIAGAFLAAFVGLTVDAWGFGRVQGPVVGPFIPICATLWGAADLLTAFLLLTQFSVNGIRAFAFLGAAYAYTGLLTIPYIVFFPGLFFDASQPFAKQQVSAYLWLDWHIVFPLVIAGYRIYDPDFRRRFLSGARIRVGLRVGSALIFACAAFAAGAVILLDGRLPPIIDHGHFTAIWSDAFAPLVFLLNAGAATLVIGFARKPSLLQLWLAVALAMSALDGLLNAWAIGRYTLAWYLGKAETLATASVVMLMLLSEVGALYRRLGTMAIVDALTGLRNRRSFDEYLRWTLGHRTKSDVAFLLIDIDFFKQYNDRYGHAEGDTCLRRVADVLRESLWRTVDLVARYGGEEFVVLLPDTTAAGAFEVAERIRKRVEALGIVTVSVGVAHASPSNPLDGDRLFALADRALYTAKVGRNVTVVADSSVVPGPEVAELQLQTLE